MNSVVEDSAAFFSVALEGTDGNPDAPLQAFVSVYCMTTRTVIRPETPLTSVGSTMEIDTTPTENALIRRSNASETKRIFLRAPYGVNDQFTAYFDYIVQRARPL